MRVTFRLTDSPACLVADDNELSANLVRMLKAAGQDAPDSQPILEINPDHPLVKRLKYEDAAAPRSATGPICCSTRPCWPKAAAWRIRRRS